jgi:D-3-phosphoglycerate dehydrogenase
MYRVVLVDYDEDLFSPRGGEAELLASAGIAWEAGRWRTEEEVVAHAQDADVVIIQSLRKLLNARTIPQLRRCKGIISAGIGYDTVDVETATAHGILVANVPEYCLEDVAEHALTLLLAALRGVVGQDRSMRRGEWSRQCALRTRRLRGLTLGLVGFGRIARALVEKSAGLGLRYLAYDPYVQPETAAAYSVSLVDLETLLRQSDLISIHVPLNAETWHLIGERELGMVKPGAVLVNTSRGPVVDEQALIRALQDGRLGAAGLDVFEEEPLPVDSPLRQMENVVLTPHTAAYSEDAAVELYRQACQEAIDIIAGRIPKGAVNAHRLGKSR